MKGTLAWLVVLAGTAAGAEEAAKPAELKTVVPGAQYEAGALHRWLLGAHHRDLWTAALQVPVLDLDHFAGGLTVLKRGGRGQTKALRFRGRDGHEYTFRSVDKDPQVLLSPELKRTFVARVLQDQMSVGHPLGALVAAPITEAAGVLHATPTLAVMPDDPRLGENRAEFAGILGLIEERPTEGADGEPGFEGAVQVIGSDTLLQRLEKDFDDRVDSRSYLRARLMDVFLGDWDRHLDQWRWARFEGEKRVWKAVPRDRDQAFARMDGLLLWMAGFSHPELVGFEPEYPPMMRITWSGRLLDRQLLSDLEWPAWEQEARDLQSHLTDAAIDAAVKQLPAQAPFDQSARKLAEAMKKRRDHLLEAARGFYEILAGEVDVYGTDKPEVVEVAHRPDGAAEVTLRGRKEDQPYFRRTFLPRETSEVRLYLQGGDDKVSVSGESRAEVKVRVVGGGGDDSYASAGRPAGDRLRIYDERGTNQFDLQGGGSVDPNPPVLPFEKKKKARVGIDQGAKPRDWGAKVMPRLQVGFDPDHGLILGGAVARERYGFRQVPYRQKHDIGLAYATAAEGLRGHYVGLFHLAGRRSFLRLAARASQFELLHFNGFGNETAEPVDDDDFNRVDEDLVRLEAGLVVPLSPSLQLAFGGRFVGADAGSRQGALLSQLHPYGTGRLDRAGLEANLRFDTRDVPRFASRGVLAWASASFTPAVLDAVESYGDLAGEAAGHLPLGGEKGPVVALRASGRKVFGTFPFTEAAFLGGSDSLRGFPEQRFAGEASLYGSAELRLRLGSFFILLPGEFGVFGLADTGRVFVDGEDSSRWHNAAGGGIWFNFLDRANTFTIAVAHSREGNRVSAGGGFAF